MIRHFGIKAKFIFGIERELLSRNGEWEYLFQDVLRVDFLLKPEQLLSGLY